VVKTVSGAALPPSGGAVGTLFTTTELPLATTFGGGIGVDDHLFVIGGRDQILGVPPRSTVHSAALQAGLVNAWTPATALPAPRANLALAVAGNYIYVLGGGNEGPGEANVWVSQVRRP